MRKLLIAAFAIILAIGGAGPAAARKPAGSSAGSHSSSTAPKVHVRGYTRKDGTYVAPHDRAYPGTGSHSYTPKSLGTVPHLAPPAGGGPTGRTSTPYSSGTHSLSGLQRDSHGKIKRSGAAKDSFKRLHPCPATGRSSGPCPEYIIDHIVPLCASGPDAAYNMQWQTTVQSKEKDRWERTQCNAFPKR
jgi:hypothetical protein